MSVILIGIDGIGGWPGSGRAARRLARELEHAGATGIGVTRHQLLSDRRIPRAAHNSASCVAVDWAGALNELEFVCDLIERWAPKGSNPGICIVAHEDMPNEVVDWGWAATQQILSLARAVDLAAEHDVFLHALGGTGEGIIGAMASVGLRGCVNQGRLLDWPLLLQVGAGRHEEQIGSPLATGWEMR